MGTLRVRLASVGASLALVFTGVGGVGSALADHSQDATNTAVAAACFNVAVAEANDFGVNNQTQVIAVFQDNDTAAYDYAVAVGGTNEACVAEAEAEQENEWLNVFE